jgi:hypothetical protein
MTRIVLLISFLFFFGRFVYSSIGAWYHHQDKKRRRSQRSPSSPPPASNPLILMPDTPHPQAETPVSEALSLTRHVLPLTIYKRTACSRRSISAIPLVITLS